VRGPRRPARAFALLALAGLTLLPSASGGTPAVRLDLEPRLALRDVPLDLRVTGLEPDERVTIRAEELTVRGRT